MSCRLLILTLFLISDFCFGQDRIFKKNNSIILAKVKEVGTSEIKYLNYPIKDEVINTLPIEQVSIIIYENGTTEVFPDKPQAQINLPHIRDLEHEAKFQRRIQNQKKRESNKELTLKRKNYIYYNGFELFDNSFGLSYSRNFLKNYFCLSIPLSFGYNTPYFTNGLLTETKREYYMTKKTLDAGFGLNYYIHHFSYGSPYIGLMGRLAQFEGKYDLGRGKENYFILNKYYLYFTFGYRLRTTTGFSFTTNINLGSYQNDYLSSNPVNNYTYLSRYNTSTSANFSFQLGYNF